MYLKKAAAALILLLLLRGTCLAGEIPEGYRSRSKTTMGTFATISTLCVFDNFDDPAAGERFSRLWEETKALLTQMDELMSASMETSEIARFNALSCGESMAVSPMTAELFRLCQDMYALTDGYFDPTILPLVDLWGFTPRFRENRKDLSMPYDRPWTDGGFPMPEQKYIDAFLQLVGLPGIQLTGSDDTGWTLVKNIPDVTVDGVTYAAQIDFGGIAKGYAVDLVTEMMKEAGIEYGYFSCGGSSIGLLKSASFASREARDPSFRLDVRAPRFASPAANTCASVRVMDQNLSSSGDYENVYETDSYLCSHIINPFTGYPLNVNPGQKQQGICAVTLLSGNAVEDDALTTALCLMGPEKASAFYEQRLSDRDILMVTYGEDSTCGVITNLSEDRLTLTNEAYAVVRILNGGGEGQATAP